MRNVAKLSWMNEIKMQAIKTRNNNKYMRDIFLKLS